jgi:hypothetical protein
MDADHLLLAATAALHLALGGHVEDAGFGDAGSRLAVRVMAWSF